MRKLTELEIQRYDEISTEKLLEDLASADEHILEMMEPVKLEETENNILDHEFAEKARLAVLGILTEYKDVVLQILSYRNASNGALLGREAEQANT